MTESHYVVAFRPDRVLSRHPSYTAALDEWTARGSSLDESVRSTDDPRWKYAGHVGSKAPDGFMWARVTPAEMADWRRDYGGLPRHKRLVCEACGTRIWGSGMGCGSHRRHCKQTFRNDAVAGRKAKPGSRYVLYVAGENTDHTVTGRSPAKALRELAAAAGLSLASQNGRYGKLQDGRHVAAMTEAWGRVDSPDARTTRV